MFKKSFAGSTRVFGGRGLFGSWVLGLALLGLTACNSQTREPATESAPRSEVAKAGSAGGARQGIQQVASMRQFKSEVLNQPGKTVVDFYATWCQPCRLYSPTLEKMAEEKLPGVNFKKVDVDKASEIAREYGVEALPTTIIFENGKEVQRLMGMQSEAALKQALGV